MTGPAAAIPHLDSSSLLSISAVSTAQSTVSKQSGFNQIPFQIQFQSGLIPLYPERENYKLYLPFPRLLPAAVDLALDLESECSVSGICWCFEAPIVADS